MRDVIAGLILLIIASVATWQGSALTVGTPRHLGPGMVPLVLSALIALIGVILVGIGLRHGRAHRDRWPLRGPVFILGSAVVFGLVIRSLGLAVAGPLLIVVGALASAESRWFEVVLFAAGMTIFCVVLFKHLLSLPIPLAPLATLRAANTSVTALRKGLGAGVEDEAEVADPSWAAAFQGPGSSVGRGGLERGTAYHRVLEKLQLEETCTPDRLGRELDRLRASGVLSQQEWQWVETGVIDRFWRSALGQSLQARARDIRRDDVHFLRPQPTEIVVERNRRPALRGQEQFGDHQ